MIDKAYYKEIFYSMYPRLVSYSLKFVKNEFLAEEAAENVMMELWENRNRFEKVNDIKSYLYSMTKNECMLILKGEHNLRQLDYSISDESHEFDFNLFEEEIYAVLVKAVNSLPDKCRMIFELSCLEGMKYKDIAEELNVSVNTVKSQRARAIEILKKKLSNFPELLFILLFL